MSGKRAASNELNHDNWDDEDEPEERGVFRTASKEELQKRVIRTGRRRLQAGTSSTQDKSSIFSGFSGFNKPAPTSFDFLSKLTNGTTSNTTNGSSAPNETTPIGSFDTSSNNNNVSALNNSTNLDNTKGLIFGSQPPMSSASSLFGVTSTPTTTESKGSLFGTLSPGSTTTNSLFGVPSKAADSKPASIFGSLSKETPPVSTGSAPGFSFGILPKPNTDSDYNTSKQNEPKPAINFGIPSETKKDSSFGIVSNSFTPLSETKLLTASSPTSMFNYGSKVNSYEVPSAKKTKPSEMNDEGSSDDKTQYYSKLKGLNESVSEWIKKHVSENPLCILTPIFKDYEKYLKELEKEHNSKENSQKTGINEGGLKFPSTVGSSIFTNSSSSKNTNSSEKPDFSSGSSTSTSKPFSFGSTVNTSSSITTTAITFGSNSVASPFSSIAGSTPAPFSFGIGQPFSFNANATKAPEQTQENKDEKDEDEPPKVEFTPIAEENSVFDTRCKVFVKKDGDFVDKGVGTLYIKTIENSPKHQLIVRANTSLGAVLLNFILSDSIPLQKMGKNNVMAVCIPTPDAKPPPVTVLIRVKTSEEADDLLKKLNEFKK